MENLPALGAPAPDFDLPSTHGQLSLAAFRGRKLLIYFYPKDDTPGCTRQACALNDDLRSSSEAVAHNNSPALHALDLQVVGVSRDSVASHKKFAQKFGLKFPLLSDESGEMCAAYGVWVEKSMYGKKYFGIERSSFLIDENGKLIAALRKVAPDEHLALVKTRLTGIINSTTSEIKPAATLARAKQTPSGKVTTMATTAKKAAPKKTTATKKPAAKKPAVKKATATKKPAAKKTTAKKATTKAATAKKSAATATKKTTAKKPATKKPAAKKKAA